MGGIVEDPIALKARYGIEVLFAGPGFKQSRNDARVLEIHVAARSTLATNSLASVYIQPFPSVSGEENVAVIETPIREFRSHITSNTVYGVTFKLSLNHLRPITGSTFVSLKCADGHELTLDLYKLLIATENFRKYEEKPNQTVEPTRAPEGASGSP